jgi:hypothetical protein
MPEAAMTAFLAFPKAASAIFNPHSLILTTFHLGAAAFPHLFNV